MRSLFGLAGLFALIVGADTESTLQIIAGGVLVLAAAFYKEV